MTQAGDPPRRPPRVAIVLTVLAGVLATAIAYLGTRENPPAPLPPPAAPAVDASLTVHMIVLPYDEPELPNGPHQRTFIASCTICHSTRLVMTQPPFPRAKWVEIVQKMVKTYGATISPEEETRVADYLTAVRGK
jgi:hypothetical protein